MVWVKATRIQSTKVRPCAGLSFLGVLSEIVNTSLKGSEISTGVEISVGKEHRLIEQIVFH